MESLDRNTRLPPRKRLLTAGMLNKESYNSLPNIPSFYSELLYNRMHKAINVNTSCNIEEVIEEVNSVTFDAAESAKIARNSANEKWIVAVKAKAAAKSALELLDVVNEGCNVEKSKLGNGTIENDEEVARRLHKNMNSSPRITKTQDKYRKNGGDYSNKKGKLDFTVEKHRLGPKVVNRKQTKANKRKKMLLSQFNTLKSLDESEAKIEAMCELKELKVN